MIRKLRDTGDANGYTATALLLVDWDTGSGSPVVTAQPDLVPEDVRPAQFFTRLIDRALTVTPVAYHVAVRERRERRDIPVAEADVVAQPEGVESQGEFSGGPECGLS